MTQERYLFLCGAEMDPTAVRRAHPAARFVARARVAGDAGGEVWGILLQTAEGGATTAESDGPEREVVTDDRRRERATAPAGWRPGGEPAAILAAARYWELPPSYGRGLAASAQAAEE